MCVLCYTYNSMLISNDIFCILSRFATILAFDVKVERDAQELADSIGVKIFQADIIYHLFDRFTAYREELKQKKREEFKTIAVFPCKLKVSKSIVSVHIIIRLFATFGRTHQRVFHELKCVIRH